jgi:molybdopterin molybdotransferase
MGIDKCRRIRLKDRPALLEKRLADAMERADVVVAVGGMSVGDRDFVRPILGKLGVEEKFWRVAIKPGKPTYFGLLNRRGRGRPCLVFGLPGNPVSALVCFHQFVKPALSKMMGVLPATRLTLPARLVGERRKQPGRLEWLRGIMSCQGGDITAEPTAGQDSHMLGGLARANCLIHFPQAADHLADGSPVVVEPLLWHE